jgi:hypothetical protein
VAGSNLHPPPSHSLTHQYPTANWRNSDYMKKNVFLLVSLIDPPAQEGNIFLEHDFSHNSAYYIVAVTLDCGRWALQRGSIGERDIRFPGNSNACAFDGNILAQLWSKGSSVCSWAVYGALSDQLCCILPGVERRGRHILSSEEINIQPYLSARPSLLCQESLHHGRIPESVERRISRLAVSE